jgi:predicted Zn-dependent protease
MMTVRTGCIAFVAGGCLLALWACATTPYTKRSQLMLMSESEEMRLGVAAYNQVLSKERLVTDPAIVGVVQRIGERIARAAEKPEYQWQFSVIDNPKTVNAFALPGGKVAVYTGLFPVAKDEGGLAAVIGHEVAHALARHGAERMSQGTVLQLGGAVLGAAVGTQAPALSNAVMAAYGLGAQVGVLLPFSRSQESEADHIGMILMAKAGYDPESALFLWQRMEASEKGGKPPQWLSTHPSAATRQEQIRGWLPEARAYLSTDPTVTNNPLPVIAARDS